MLGRKEEKVPDGEWWKVVPDQESGVVKLKQMFGKEETGKEEPMTERKAKQLRRKGVPVVVTESTEAEYYQTLWSWLEWKRRIA